MPRVSSDEEKVLAQALKHTRYALRLVDDLLFDEEFSLPGYEAQQKLSKAVVWLEELRAQYTDKRKDAESEARLLDSLERRKEKLLDDAA